MPMRCLHSSSVVVALLAMVSVSVPSAHAESIIFDFEDGLQGWIPLPVAERLNAGMLGGMYTIWGLDNGRIIQSIDLTGMVQMTLEQRWFGELHPDVNLVSLMLIQLDAQGTTITRWEVVGEGTSLSATLSDPRPNPDYRVFDISGWDGPTNVIVVWNDLVCSPEDLGPCFEITFPGWIDNLAFHTEAVPEPALRFGQLFSMLTLLGLHCTKRRSFGRRKENQCQ